MDNGERLALEFMSKALEILMDTGKGTIQGIGTIGTETFKAIYQFKKENRLQAGENNIEKLRNSNAMLGITQIEGELNTEKFVVGCKNAGIPCSVNQIGEKNIVTFLKSDEELVKLILEEMVKENVKNIEPKIKEVVDNKPNIDTVDEFGTVSAETFDLMNQLAKESGLKVGENVIEKLKEPDVSLGITKLSNDVGNDKFLESCKKEDLSCSVTQLGEKNIVTYLKSDEELIKDVLEKSTRENIKETSKSTSNPEPIKNSEYKKENKNPNGNIKKLVKNAQARLKEKSTPSIDKEKSLDNAVKSVQKER